jgi:hypothetical protein
MIINGIELKHVSAFVLGMSMAYYRVISANPMEMHEYTEETLNKVWKYLTQKGVSLDASFSDHQVNVAVEAGKVFFKVQQMFLINQILEQRK